MSFRKVAAVDDLWRGEMLGVTVDGRKVLLVNVEDRIYAYEDRCVHQGVALSEGRLQGGVLRCRAHEWEYDARGGRGMNPPRTQLRSFAIRVEEGDVFVDVTRILAEKRGPELERRPDDRRAVGPVLQAGALCDAVRAAIQELNGRVRVLDRGAYVRILVPDRCRVTRGAVERRAGRPLRFPADLEQIMPSFQGELTITEEEAIWSAKDAPAR
jgi:toluene monooxygenase system ferredoxin subunit